MQYDNYTREERVKLILEDSDTYLKLLTGEHLFMLLDGIAKTKKHEEAA